MSALGQVRHPEADQLGLRRQAMSIEDFRPFTVAELSSLTFDINCSLFVLEFMQR